MPCAKCPTYATKPHMDQRAASVPLIPNSRARPCISLTSCPNNRGNANTPKSPRVPSFTPCAKANAPTAICPATTPARIHPFWIKSFRHNQKKPSAHKNGGRQAEISGPRCMAVHKQYRTWLQSNPLCPSSTNDMQNDCPRFARNFCNSLTPTW